MKLRNISTSKLIKNLYTLCNYKPSLLFFIYAFIIETLIKTFRSILNKWKDAGDSQS